MLLDSVAPDVNIRSLESALIALAKIYLYLEITNAASFNYYFFFLNVNTYYNIKKYKKFFIFYKKKI